MCAFQLFLSVDPSLGRVDYSSLSDQTLMEMLIEGFDDETKNKYKDNEGMYLNVCKWSRIECDGDERVIRVVIETSSITGSLELCYVPPKVKELYMRSPYRSELTGSVDLTRLPDGIKYLYLYNSELSGEIDLAHLPGKMQLLYLQNNQLTGEIDLKQLPGGMKELALQNNKLTGGIDFTHLPDGMSYLNLDENHLTGQLVIKMLPPTMRVINARRNQFNAVAVVESETNATIKLQESGVTSVVDENGREQVMKRFL